MTKGELLINQFRRYANTVDIMTKMHSREILNGYGNSELNCIDCIGHMKRPNAARISEKMGLTRSAVSKTLRKLLSKDAVSAYQLPGNQKEIYYRLTPYGRELFEQHRLRHTRWETRDQDYFDSLDSGMVDTALQFMNSYNGFLELKLAEEMSGTTEDGSGGEAEADTEQAKAEKP